MKQEYINRLIELAEQLDLACKSQTEAIDVEKYTAILKEKANYLIGYILALENFKVD